MVGANPGGQCASGPRRRPRRRRPHPIRSIPALAVTHDRTAEQPGAERGATIAAGLWNDAATGNGGGCPSRGSQGLALQGQYQLSTDAAARAATLYRPALEGEARRALHLLPAAYAANTGSAPGRDNGCQDGAHP